MRRANVTKRLVHTATATITSSNEWGDDSVEATPFSIDCYCYYGSVLSKREQYMDADAEKRWTVLCGVEDGSRLDEGDKITNITRINPLTGDADPIHPGGRISQKIALDHRLEGVQLYQFIIAPN